MSKRIISTLCVLIAVVMNLQAQALSERYNKQQPVVIAADNHHYTEYAKAVTERLGLPTKIMKMNDNQAVAALENGQADVIITARNLNNAAYTVSKSYLSYTNISADTSAAVRFVGKDRQRIEQIDDQFTRLKQEGEIANIDESWQHPELMTPHTEETVLHITDALLILTIILVVLSMVIMWHKRTTRRHTREVSEMISQAQQINKYYAIEDNQAAHDLAQKYQAILHNPFVAIAIYDGNGQLIVENEAMIPIGHNQVMEHRQPLFNPSGQVVNFITAIKI